MNYINTPLCYTGSKFKILDQLIPHFDTTKQNFYDVFCGGGSVFTNVVHLYENIIANDIILDVVSILENLKYLSFVDRTRELCVAKDNQAGYISLRKNYNEQPTPAKLFALLLCCTNNMIRFNQKMQFNQTFGKRTFNLKTLEKIKAYRIHMEPHWNKVTFTNKNFTGVSLDECHLNMYYFDPPYHSKVNNDAGYNNGWNNEKDEQLYMLIKEVDRHGGSFCLSNVYSENSALNSFMVNHLISDGYRPIILNCDYKKISRNKNKTEMAEIIIKNY